MGPKLLQLIAGRRLIVSTLGRGLYRSGGLAGLSDVEFRHLCFGCHGYLRTEDTKAD